MSIEITHYAFKERGMFFNRACPFPKEEVFFAVDIFFRKKKII